MNDLLKAMNDSGKFNGGEVVAGTCCTLLHFVALCFWLSKFMGETSDEFFSESY